jgi:hypothetical protein
LPKFDVCMTWIQYCSSSFVVEADSEDEAQDLIEDNRDALYAAIISNDKIDDNFGINGPDDFRVEGIEETDADARVDAWAQASLVDDGEDVEANDRVCSRL